MYCWKEKIADRITGNDSEAVKIKIEENYINKDVRKNGSMPDG